MQPDQTRRMPAPMPGRPEAPTEPIASIPRAGAVLGGRYRLDGLLGAGGMADVHRAEDLRLHRPVAVKVFRPGTDPDGERRFEAEARTLAGLRHPGLVAVHDYAVEHGRGYLVMELVEGPTLAEELARERYDAAGATQLGSELAQVLGYVHAQGVVHRDVKPSNVLVDSDGRFRLADFGISHLVDASGLTPAEPSAGTTPYLSPEQVQRRPTGPPADVYALALVLLEAMSGRPEYPGDGSTAADDRLRRPPVVPPELPEPLRSTLQLMTALDPARRPDAPEVAARLGRPPEPDAPPAPAPGRGRWIALAAIGVLVLGLLFALVMNRAEDTTATPAAPTTSAEPVAPGDEPGDEPVAPSDLPEPPGSPSDLPDLPDLPTNLPDLPSNLPDLPDLPDLPSNLPDLPSDLPDLPTALPDVPDGAEVPQDVRNLWDRFTDWFSGLL